ncbi:MAG: hypothetical protein GY708_19745, partial [Actinomycetia bacterium]|nr:hypothetical protein [Actinomycetes bacterium]
MTEVGPNGDKSDVTLLTGHDEGLPDRSPPTSRAGLVVAGLVAVAVLGGLIALTSSPSPDEQPPEASEHDPTEGSPSEVGLVDAAEPAGS